MLPTATTTTSSDKTSSVVAWSDAKPGSEPELLPQQNPRSEGQVEIGVETSITSLTKKAGLTVEELVADVRREPLSAANFRLFLATRHHAEENFDFLVDTRNFKKDVTQPAARRRSQANTQVPTEAAHQKMDEIVGNYIAENGTKQVNLSDQLRQETIRRAEAAKHPAAAAAIPSVFDPAAAEVAYILKHAGYLAMFVSEAAKNITYEEVVLRRVGAVVYSAISLLICVLLVLSGVDRWYRLFCVLPTFMAFLCICQAQCGV